MAVSLSKCRLSRNGGVGMSFDVTNCRKCGRLFHRVSQPICPECMKELEDKYQEVKEYLKEHDKATVVEISQELDVSVEQIKKWVREERLYFTDPSASGIECLMCGIPITKGKYCARCAEKMANRLGKTIRKEPAMDIRKDQRDTKDRMRFLDK